MSRNLEAHLLLARMIAHFKLKHRAPVSTDLRLPAVKRPPANAPRRPASRAPRPR